MIKKLRKAKNKTKKDKRKDTKKIFVLFFAALLSCIFVTYLNQLESEFEPNQVLSQLKKQNSILQLNDTFTVSLESCLHNRGECLQIEPPNQLKNIPFPLTPSDSDSYSSFLKNQSEQKQPISKVYLSYALNNSAIDFLKEKQEENNSLIKEGRRVKQIPAQIAIYVPPSVGFGLKILESTEGQEWRRNLRADMIFHFNIEKLLQEKQITLVFDISSQRFFGPKIGQLILTEPSISEEIRTIWPRYETASLIPNLLILGIPLLLIGVLSIMETSPGFIVLVFYSILRALKLAFELIFPRLNGNDISNLSSSSDIFIRDLLCTFLSTTLLVYTLISSRAWPIGKQKRIFLTTSILFFFTTLLWMTRSNSLVSQSFDLFIDSISFSICFIITLIVIFIHFKKAISSKKNTLSLDALRDLQAFRLTMILLIIAFGIHAFESLLQFEQVTRGGVRSPLSPWINIHILILMVASFVAIAESSRTMRDMVARLEIALREFRDHHVFEIGLDDSRTRTRFDALLPGITLLLKSIPQYNDACVYVSWFEPSIGKMQIYKSILTPDNKAQFEFLTTESNNSTQFLDKMNLEADLNLPLSCQYDHRSVCSLFVKIKNGGLFSIEKLMLSLVRQEILLEWKFIEKDRRFSLSTPKLYLEILGIRSILEAGKCADAEQDLTVVFTDLGGWTHYSTQVDSRRAAQVIGEMLGILLPILERNHGGIDKSTGDGYMLVFGNESAALLCVAELADAVNDWIKFTPDLRDAGVTFRTGMSRGQVTVKVEQKGAYVTVTSVGDAVNTASRMEGLGKIVSCLCCLTLASDRLLPLSHLLSPRWKIKYLGPIIPLGKTFPDNVYGLFETPLEGESETDQLFEQAIQHFENKSWLDAQHAFQYLEPLLAGEVLERLVRLYLEESNKRILQPDQFAPAFLTLGQK